MITEASLSLFHHMEVVIEATICILNDERILHSD